MRKVIWKFKIMDGINIEMPKDAEILTVQVQNDRPYIWVLLNPDDKKETRTFEVFGTGHPIYYDMGVNRKYIGTFQQENGMLVWHLFERIN